MVNEGRHSKPHQDVLAGGGEMGERMRMLDWSKTLLGPVEGWPQSLKTSVSTCLNSRFPVLIWWGAELVKLYNDAYAPILGNKHPRALGAAGKEIWPEIWHIIGPMPEGVMERAEATWSDNLLLELEGSGYPEERYFTFSYSPIRDESGGVGGVFTPVQETTQQVIGERRLRTLRDLAEGARIANAQTPDDVCRAAAETIAKNGFDIPFAAWYLLSETGEQARLAARTARASLFPDSIQLGESSHWLARAAAFTSTTVLALSEPPGDIPCGAWPVPPDHMFILPMGQRIGFAVLGVSPRKHLDEDYRAFFSLIAQHLNTAMVEVFAAQAERSRALALADLDRKKTAESLRESEQRQAFLLKVSDAMRPLEDAEEIRTTAAQLLGEHLGAAGVAYAQDGGDGHFEITKNYINGVPNASGRFATPTSAPISWRTCSPAVHGYSPICGKTID